MSSTLEQLVPIYKRAGQKLNWASQAYFSISLEAFVHSDGGALTSRKERRLAKRLRPALNSVADAVVDFQACRNTILQVCVEESLDWKATCEGDPELKMWEDRNQDYFEATSDEEVLEAVSRWRPGPRAE